MVYMKQFLFALTLFLYCGLGLAQLKFGPGVSEAGDTLDTIVAIVDDDIITRAELNSAVADARRQLQGQNRQPPATDVLEPQILERLIMAKLQRSAAEREGIVVDDPTLNAAVESIARQNKMDLSQLRQALQRDGQMPAGDLDLVLLEQVEPIGPILHHHAALLDVFGVVVGGADAIGVGM